MTAPSQGGSMRRSARFSWVATAAAVPTAVVIGAALAGGGSGGAQAPALVGGPPASHTDLAGRYSGPTEPYAGPTRDVTCDKGSMPETVQGKAPKADFDSGRAAKGYFCNARLISHYGNSGGYR